MWKTFDTDSKFYFAKQFAERKSVDNERNNIKLEKRKIFEIIQNAGSWNNFALRIRSVSNYWRGFYVNGIVPCIEYKAVFFVKNCY